MVLHLWERKHHGELGGDRDEERNLLLGHGADVKGYRFGTLCDRTTPNGASIQCLDIEGVLQQLGG